MSRGRQINRDGYRSYSAGDDLHTALKNCCQYQNRIDREIWVGGWRKAEWREQYQRAQAQEQIQTREDQELFERLWLLIEAKLEERGVL